MGASPLRRLRCALGNGSWAYALTRVWAARLLVHVLPSTPARSFRFRPFVGDACVHQPGTPPKADPIAEEIGIPILLVNDSYEPSSCSSSDAHSGNMASYLTWAEVGELAID